MRQTTKPFYRIVVYLLPGQYAALREMAHRLTEQQDEKITISSLVREAVDQYLAPQGERGRI